MYLKIGIYYLYNFIVIGYMFPKILKNAFKRSLMYYYFSSNNILRNPYFFLTTIFI